MCSEISLSRPWTFSNSIVPKSRASKLSGQSFWHGLQTLRCASPLLIAQHISTLRIRGCQYCIGSFMFSLARCRRKMLKCTDSDGSCALEKTRWVKRSNENVFALRYQT